MKGKREKDEGEELRKDKNSIKKMDPEMKIGRRKRHG